MAIAVTAATSARSVSRVPGRAMRGGTTKASTATRSASGTVVQR